MTHSRRTFLRSAAAGGFAAGLGSLWGRSLAGGTGAGAARNLVLVMNAGGWDTTYLFDPKPDSDRVDTPEGQFRAFGDMNLWMHSSRPAVETFFERYADVTALINGINVPAVSHPGCLVRALTGTRDTSSPDFASIAGHVLGADTPIPYLVFGEAGFKGPYAASVGHVGSTSQLRALVDPAEAYEPSDGPWQRHTPSPDEEALIRSFLDGRLAREQTGRGVRGLNRQRLDDFVLSLDRGHQLGDVADVFGDRGRILRLPDQTTLAAEALERGVCSAVMIDGRLGWDTHANNDRQSDFQDQTFTSLSALMEELEGRPGSGGTLLDETLIVVLSEMGRTPLLNEDGGKDHWPFTSMLVAGAGVAGGTVSGATDDGLTARPVNLETGAVDDSGVQMGTEHVMGGILELLGIDPSEHLPGVGCLRGFHA